MDQVFKLIKKAIEKMSFMRGMFLSLQKKNEQCLFSKHVDYYLI
jgi:hypothetical protein